MDMKKKEVVTRLDGHEDDLCRAAL